MTVLTHETTSATQGASNMVVYCKFIPCRTGGSALPLFDGCSLVHVQTMSFTPCTNLCLYPLHKPMPLPHAPTYAFTPSTNLCLYLFYQTVPFAPNAFETVNGNRCLPCYTKPLLICYSYLNWQAAEKNTLYLSLYELFKIKAILYQGCLFLTF